MSSNTREEWLINAAEILRGTFNPTYTVPDIKVSVGWPSSRGLSKRNKAIGQCWSSTVSKDNKHQIFISPLLDDKTEVLATLIHEMAHAAVGVSCGHRGEFVKCIRHIGLEGKPTATVAGESLTGILEAVSVVVGEYPHAGMDPTLLEKERKKQTTRLLKVVCNECEGEAKDKFKGRFSLMMLVNKGMPSCPCGAEMEPDGWEIEDD